MSDTKKGLILIVDDEDALRRAVARVLQGAGFEVLEAGTGADALQLVESHPIDTIVSDVTMPNMTGHELLKAVRRRAPDVPMILTTGDSSADGNSRAVLDGALCCLVKPVAKAVLTEAVERGVRLKRKPAVNAL